MGYFASDNQSQESFSTTNLNIGDDEVFFDENIFYKKRKKLASGELELKYYNGKNYITNLFIYKNTPNEVNSDIQSNNLGIHQNLEGTDETFYNHFNYTVRIGSRSLLKNYFYFGKEKLEQESGISSPVLNDFFENDTENPIVQTEKHCLSYFGLKSEWIKKANKLSHAFGIHLENNDNESNSDIFMNGEPVKDFENNLALNHFYIGIEDKLRYNFSDKLYLDTSLKYSINYFKINGKQHTFGLFSPKIIFNYKTENKGDFRLLYTFENKLPTTTILVDNYTLIDYRNFLRGTDYEKPLSYNTFSLSYNLFDDVSRFSMSAGFVYSISQKEYLQESDLTSNLGFMDYAFTNGGEFFNFNFGIVNYIKSLKLATELKTTQTWNNRQAKLNNERFSLLKNHSGSYEISATTYFEHPINFNFGVNYRTFDSEYLQSKESTNIQKGFFEVDYELSDNWLAGIKSDFYQIEKDFYSFLNVTIEHNPRDSNFSVRLTMNNLLNESKFTTISINDYAYYRSSIPLVPRYLLATVKYRF